MGFFSQIRYTLGRYGILTKVIAVNVAVFLTVNIIGNLSHLSLLEYLGLPIGGDHFLYRFWTLFTYMFTHADLWHMFWNMFLFYFMAQIFFTIMGEKKMLYVYVMSGLAGGALMIILGMVMPGRFSNSILIGASAAVLGVGGVMAMYAPNFRVALFGVFEMAYKYFYLIVFVVNTIIDLSVNTGGKISHVGGAFFGVLYGYYLKKGTDLFNFSLPSLKRKKLRVVHRDGGTEPGTAASSDEQKMNALLDKISRSGYDSLTRAEKEELFRLSQKK
jgi:membrane associated rhomboid family serine protease